VNQKAIFPARDRESKHPIKGIVKGPR